MLPVDTEVEETEQPTSETEVVDVGKRRLIRGGGLVTRISDNKEPQFDDNRKYHEQPVRKKDTMMYENYNIPVPRNTDSDDSDEMLPIGTVAYKYNARRSDEQRGALAKSAAL